MQRQIATQDTVLPSSATAFLEIDTQAISHNYKALHSKLDENTCAAVLKADAYGFGTKIIAPLLRQEGCKTFFVAHLDEGMILRELVKDAEIYVLSGVLPETESYFVQHSLTPVLNDFEMLKRWVRHAQRLGEKLNCVLHFDTGMNRLGFDLNETTKLFESWGLLESIEIQFIMSHLTSSQNLSDPMNEKQREKFESLRLKFPNTKASLADTGGIYLGKSYHYDFVRPGKGLFGLFKAPELRPCLTLFAQILQIREAHSGETVGYDGTHTLNRKSQLATLAIGFADGYDRRFSNHGQALIHGFKAPILGRISMDYMVIDVTDIPESLCHVGGWVELVSKSMDLDTLAHSIGTISRELSTGFSSRLHRIYR